MKLVDYTLCELRHSRWLANLTKGEPLLTHHANGVYIINFKEIVYHQHKVLHIIKSQREYTLTRDDIHLR